MEGRVRAGFSGGGICYGYDVVRETDSAGNPVRGKRTVNEGETKIVRSIFREFVGGISPTAIAKSLNAQGIPGPRGKDWGPSTIYGNWRRGTGILNNELYIGRLVWNRQHFVKDPATGRRQARPNPESDNRNYYRNHILPHFKGRLIAGIDSRDVRQWFASLHAKPAAADRSAPILSVIMRQAEIYGYRPEGSNPCKGIKRYRREGRERFLSAAETRSLAAVLDRFEADRPQQAAIIRLLLLTGCRASEVRTLKWRYRREGKLFLPDSKTGPRTVWLSSAARAILDRVPRTASWMFPSPRTNGPLSHNGLDETWRRIRDEADLRDVRLHDLRHSFASRALALGETLPVITRLLGHSSIDTTAAILT